MNAAYYQKVFPEQLVGPAAGATGGFRQQLPPLPEGEFWQVDCVSTNVETDATVAVRVLDLFWYRGEVGENNTLAIVEQTATLEFNYELCDVAAQVLSVTAITGLVPCGRGLMPGESTVVARLQNAQAADQLNGCTMRFRRVRL